VTLLLTLLILVVVGLVAAVAAGRIAGGLDEPSSSLPGRGLSEGRVGVADVERVRFSPALRGYRMDEVDDVLDRLTEALQLRDQEIAELRLALGGPASSVQPLRNTHELPGWPVLDPRIDQGIEPEIDQAIDQEPDDESPFLRRTGTGTHDERGGGH
jgi:DivIVA domain-containing protein